MRNFPVHRRPFDFDAGSPNMVKVIIDLSTALMYPRHYEDHKQARRP
jgi:hypothetical protein